MEAVRSRAASESPQLDAADRLVSLFAKDREQRMVERAAANLRNQTELDAAYEKMAESSKALKFLRDRVAARTGEGETDERPAYREVYRIKGITYHTAYPAEDVELINEILIQAHARERAENPFRFTHAQAQGLLTFDRLEGLFGPIGVGWGKCLLGSTEVFSPNTGRRRADELGPLSVLTMDEESLKLRTGDAVAFESGEKPCVSLTLRTGETIRLSTDHPVFTARGWVHAADVLPDDLVATPRYVPNPNPLLGVPDAEVETCAYLMGDGGTTTHAHFTQMEGPALDCALSAARELGAIPVMRSSNSRAQEWSLNGLADKLREWGILGCKATEKRVPAAWYRLPDRQVALLLRSFFACDAHINPHRGGALELTLANEGLLSDIRFFLKRLGIQSWDGYKKATLDGKEFDAWRLNVSGAEFEKLHDAIGQIPGKPVEIERKKRNTNIDIVPIGRPEAKEIADEMDIGRSALRDRLSATDGQRISRAKFEEWVAESGYCGKYAKLASSDLLWSRVRSVEDIGTHPVYDLTVPNTHNFVANGIVVHNTFISLLCAALAWERGFKRMILHVPPQVYTQLMTRDIPQARRDLVLFGLPFIGMGGETAARRRSIATSGKRGCYVMPYSLLSTKDTSAILDAIEPELIIADEAHNLKNLRHSSRAKRINAYMRTHDPKFVALSGTITTKSIMDYRHLLEWCLGPGSCLPVTEGLALEWAKILDSETHSHGSENPESPSTGPILKLVQWARARVAEMPTNDAKQELAGALRSDRRGFRTAYRLRLESTPGVVSTPDAQIGTSLYFCNTEAAHDRSSESFQSLMRLIEGVETDWLTPQEEPIEYGLHKFKWLYELSSGFWHRLRWPSPEEYIEHRDGISLGQATDLLNRAMEHHEAQKVYHSELRKWLEKVHIKGIDTPMLVANHISRFFGSSDLQVSPLVAALYMEMRKLDFEGRPKRVSEPVWVDDFKLRHAVSWAQRKKHGIVWYYHQTMGRELARALEEAGLDPLLCMAGRAADKTIAESKGRVVVASIPAHNTGKNLQFHTNQLIAQFPRPARDLEQTLGRLHRMGQEADELIVDTCLTLDFDHMLVNACLLDSLYIHQTGGGMQKAVVAGWNPLPKVFPNSVLVERGLDPNGGEAMERAMREHFGIGQKKG